jgi:hypothetical protein
LARKRTLSEAGPLSRSIVFYCHRQYVAVSKYKPSEPSRIPPPLPRLCPMRNFRNRVGPSFSGNGARCRSPKDRLLPTSKLPPRSRYSASSLCKGCRSGCSENVSGAPLSLSHRTLRVRGQNPRGCGHCPCALIRRHMSPLHLVKAAAATVAG